MGEPLELNAQMVHLQKNPKIPSTQSFLYGFDIHPRDMVIEQSTVRLLLVYQTTPLISDEIIKKYYNNREEFKKDYREHYKHEYGRMRPSLYRGASLCIITYDKSTRDSFNDVEGWYSDIRAILPSVPIGLVGFITASDNITTDEGHALANRLGLRFFETTPTDAKKVIEIYESLVRPFLAT